MEINQTCEDVNYFDKTGPICEKDENYVAFRMIKNKKNFFIGYELTDKNDINVFWIEKKYTNSGKKEKLSLSGSYSLYILNKDGKSFTVILLPNHKIIDTRVIKTKKDEFSVLLHFPLSKIIHIKIFKEKERVLSKSLVETIQIDCSE